MKIALVTLYDHWCPGARMVAAILLEAGHDVSHLHFKRQTTMVVRRGDEQQHAELREGYFIYDVSPKGNYYGPFPTAATEEEKELFVDWIQEQGMEMVGFSLLSAFAPLAEDLSLRLRRRLPHVKIVWGGTHPWFAPEESLKFADVVCLGEGEDAIVEYAADPNRRDIQNLWFNDKGTITRNPKRKLPADLDRFPMALFAHQEYLLENERVELITAESDPGFYRDSYFISTSRGCPYQCHYCSNSLKRTEYAGQAYLRRRSHEHVYRELAVRIPQFQLNALRVLDDVFLVNPKWVKKFCETYPARFGLSFGCYAYPIEGTEAMLEMAHQAGMNYMHVGVQSASSYVQREVFGRRYDLKVLLRVCQKAKEIGIPLVYDLLVYNPFENETHMRETLDFLLTLPTPGDLHTYRLAFFPGIRLTQMTLPRYEVPEKLRLFYALLYHAIRHPNVTPDMVRAWSVNPDFREDPEKLAQILEVLIEDQEKVRYLEAMVAQLRRDVSERESAKWAMHKVYSRARHAAGRCARVVGLRK